MFHKKQKSVNSLNFHQSEFFERGQKHYLLQQMPGDNSTSYEGFVETTRRQEGESVVDYHDRLLRIEHLGIISDEQQRNELNTLIEKVASGIDSGVHEYNSVADLNHKEMESGVKEYIPKSADGEIVARATFSRRQNDEVDVEKFTYVDSTGYRVKYEKDGNDFTVTYSNSDIERTLSDVEGYSEIGNIIADSRFIEEIIYIDGSNDPAEQNVPSNTVFDGSQASRIEVLARIGVLTSSEAEELRNIRNLSDDPEFKELATGVALSEMSSWGNQLTEAPHDTSTRKGLDEYLREGSNMAELSKDNYFEKLAAEYNSKDENPKRQK